MNHARRSVAPVHQSVGLIAEGWWVVARAELFVPYIIYTWPDQLSQNFRINLSRGLERHTEREGGGGGDQWFNFQWEMVWSDKSRELFSGREKCATLAVIRKSHTIRSWRRSDQQKKTRTNSLTISSMFLLETTTHLKWINRIWKEMSHRKWVDRKQSDFDPKRLITETVHNWAVQSYGFCSRKILGFELNLSISSPKP